MEGLGRDEHIHSLSSIFLGAPLDTQGSAVSATEPLLCRFCQWGGMSTGPLRQKYQPPSSQPFYPRSHPLRAPQPCPCLDTSSLYPGWDGAAVQSENCQGVQGGM